MKDTSWCRALEVAADGNGLARHADAVLLRQLADRLGLTAALERARDAEPDTLRYRIWHLPARLACHACQKVPAISTDRPWKDAFLTCWQRLCALSAPV